jgi:hypothetical protein
MDVVGLLKQLIQSAPEIIAKAAQSPLGILALLILVVGTLAVIFFWQAPVAVRVSMFVIIFGGACAFGYAVVREIPPVPPPPPPPVDVSGEWDGQGPTAVDDVRGNFQYVYFPPGNITFSFVSTGSTLSGTLRLRKGFYRTSDSEYGLLDGKIEGHRISFDVRQEFAVNDAPKVAIERFSGDVDGNQIHFTVQEDTGYPPLRFIALRRPHNP